MWVIVWIVISAIILGVFGWSVKILQEQKKAWEAFAKKAGLNYTAGKFMEPPVVSGIKDGRKITFYTDVQQTNDIRGQRFITAIEVEFGTGLPATAAIATKEYANFVSALRLEETWRPQEGADWDAGYIVKTENKYDLDKYMTPERMRILKSIFSKGNSMALFFFHDREAILRIETSDPLRNADRMEKICQGVLHAAKGLAPTDEEMKIVRRKRGGPAENPPQAQAESGSA